MPRTDKRKRCGTPGCVFEDYHPGLCTPHVIQAGSRRERRVVCAFAPCGLRERNTTPSITTSETSDNGDFSSGDEAAVEQGDYAGARIRVGPKYQVTTFPEFLGPPQSGGVGGGSGTKEDERGGVLVPTAEIDEEVLGIGPCKRQFSEIALACAGGLSLENALRHSAAMAKSNGLVKVPLKTFDDRLGRALTALRGALT